MRGAKPERALEAVVLAAVGFEPGEPVVVACSGGPDSVALASVLDRVARERAFPLVIAHVNHGVRASAWQDECVVLSIAARLGRPVKIAALDGVAADEASLREARYAQLARIARENGARTIATAHTAEDQTETVLLALFRGTGPDGLAGMPAERVLDGDLRLVRPLLRTGHDELRAELSRSGLPYALDPSNEDVRYRRSAVRTALVALREEFPGLDRAVARCAEILRAERAGDARALERRALRDRLRDEGLLRDIPFERIEAALTARPEARVFLKPGLELDAGELR
jgi:tRNA(Ile)-lysidine synthase